jgi:alanyl-tRNA synthetase
MKAERLYYPDPHLVDFDATITAVEILPDGRSGVRLDRTAFYPTSGGQPFDLGRLNHSPVVEVIDADDGDVVHVVEGAWESGARVRGCVDWPRRFDHMQQHTGQHILSAAFDRLLGARTESFHLGMDSATIDLAKELTPADIARAEADANRIVWEDRPVHIRFVDAAEAARLPLRKEPAREGLLRLIEVDDYDLSACGGTHVQRTGAIGIIAVTGWERFRGGSRIGFVCGGRALRAFGRSRDILSASTRLLSVHPDELPAAIERLQGETKDARRRVKDAQAKIAVSEAQAIAEAAQAGVAVAVMDGWDPNGLKLIASAIVARGGLVAALVSAPAPSSLLIAASPDVTVDCAAVLKQVVAKFGGKGGGRRDIAQGGGAQGDPQGIAAFLAGVLRGTPS